MRDGGGRIAHTVADPIETRDREPNAAASRVRRPEGGEHKDNNDRQQRRGGEHQREDGKPLLTMLAAARRALGEEEVGYTPRDSSLTVGA
jgi:hypothetical protein